MLSSPARETIEIRKLTGTIYWAAGAYAALASLFHLYTAGYGVFEPRVQRSMHLLFLVPLVFLAFPFGKRSPQGRPSALDWLWAALSWLASAYLIWDADRLNHRWEGASPVLPVEVAIGAMMALLVIEACRRSLSPVDGAHHLAVARVPRHQPVVPRRPPLQGYPLARMVEFVYLAGDEGMYGFLTGISANILFIYILFAAVMMKAGVGEWVIDVAVHAAGWARGGPAKIAVIGSALFGTISGSTVANVYATGSFTIPLMKRGGYAPKAAAAIEAIAGTGGQIMPPVMGAGVFIMSEVTGHLVLRHHQGGGDSRHPLLRGAVRGGPLPRPARRAPSGAAERAAVVEAGAAARVLRDPVRPHRVPARPGLLAHRRGLLHDRRHLRAVLPGPSHLDDAAQVRRRRWWRRA